ncbi:hypothetical protein WJ970_21900 [Achromobacter xylosoxidans]
MAVLPRSRCSRLLPLACIALLGACSGTPKPAKPPERVTGAGGSMLRYSSKQTTIELTPTSAPPWTRCACAPIPRPTPRNCATPARRP